VKKFLPIFILLFLVGLFRFNLIRHGALSIPDEVQYWEAGDALEKLIYKHNFPGFCAHIAGISGLFRSTDKPGHITIELIPAMVQGIVWKISGGRLVRDPQTQMITSGIHFRNPEFMRVATAFNVILSLFSLWIFYRITLLLFKENQSVALLGTAVYALLANTNIYIRHILPYNYALPVFFFSLYLALKKYFQKPGPFSLKTGCALGLLSGFGFAIYPGYYFFPVLIFGIIVWAGKEALFSPSQLVRYIAFALSSVSVLLFYELIARIGGTTYLGHLRDHASVIIMGSFEEGFTFLPKYLFEVETFIGVFMMICTLLYIFKKKRNGATTEIFPRIFGIMLAGFLFHATVSLLRQMVFYGRLLHMYYPFLVWAMMAFLADLKPPIVKKILMGGALPVLSLLSFIKFSTAYSQIAYPLDVLYQEGIKTELIDSRNFVHETEPYLRYSSPPPKDFKTDAPYRIESNFILVNFCYFSPLEGKGFKPFIPPANAKLLYQRPHLQSFPAYTYEGFTVKDRKLFKQRNYQVSIYELVQK